jgi:signal transduction histidine kinase/DNA-binding response OmpR family regulator
VDALPVGVLAEDLDRRVVLSNRALHEYLQLSPESADLIGQDWRHADKHVSQLFENQDYAARIETILGKGKAVFGDVLHAKNGMILERDFVPVLAEGRPAGALWLFRNVTDSHLQYRAVAEARKSAEDANRAKTEFMAMVSHELRSPVSIISGLAEVVASADTDDTRALCRRIELSSRNLVRLVTDLLDVSRAESGKLGINARDVQVSPLLAELQQQFAGQAGQKGLEFDFETDAAVPATLRTDPERLHQILSNLLGNAIKFTGAGQVSLSVCANTTTIDFLVRDTGPGIAPEALDTIFARFEQLASPERGSGLGLGLAISRELARAMGGDLTVASTLGQGSCFCLSLSRQEVETQNLEMQPVRADRRQRLKVLCIDDSEDFRLLLERFLDFHECLTTASAVKGIELAQCEGVDVVIVDSQLEDGSGEAVARSLRESEFAGAVIALTGDDSASTRRALIEAGCVDVLVKPVGRDALNARVESLASERSSKRILLLDDDESSRLLFARACAKEGIPPPLEAQSVAEAMMILAKSLDQICLVLADLNLDGETGIDFLEEIGRSEFATLPVVVFSSSRNPDDVRKAKASGARDYVPKPNGFAGLRRVANDLWTAYSHEQSAGE